MRLTKVASDCDFTIWAKLEFLNPGGSGKDRAAMSILSDAISGGLITRGTTVIESSSGNMGIAIAQLCASEQIPFICVVDVRTSKHNIDILKAYGARVEVVTVDDLKCVTLLEARISRVNQLLRVIPKSFWPNQYANTMNAVGQQYMMDEILDQLSDPPDFLFCAVSTCGTLRGCAQAIKSRNVKTKVVAVDALGSSIFGAPIGIRLLPGHGAGIRPPLMADHLFDYVLKVTDLECISGCRRLVKTEGVFAGGSTGGIIAALLKFRENIGPGMSCVIVCADRGERYLDTVYNDSWVDAKFGTDASEQLLPRFRR